MLRGNAYGNDDSISLIDKEEKYVWLIKRNFR